MLKIAHIINPVKVDNSSNLEIAQPITFETMRQAQAYAQGQVNVELYLTQYPEDRDVIPQGFLVLPDLERSVLDFGLFEQPRKLPLLADILDRVYHSVPDADYLIYTNVDTGLLPHFYCSVASLLQEYDAMVITRRTISDQYRSVKDIPLMLMQVGRQHHGYGCFIFKRAAYPNYQLGDIIIGTAYFDVMLYANMVAFSDNFVELKDVHLTFHIGDDQIRNMERYRDYRQYNVDQMLNLLVKLRDVVGKLDDSTVVGRYLLDRYHETRDYELRDALVRDNDPASLVIKPITLRRRLIKWLAIRMRRWIARQDL